MYHGYPEGPSQDFVDYLGEEIERLKKALERINNSIRRDGNSIIMDMTIFELKGIVETAWENTSEKMDEQNMKKFFSNELSAFLSGFRLGNFVDLDEYIKNKQKLTKDDFQNYNVLKETVGHDSDKVAVEYMVYGNCAIPKFVRDDLQTDVWNKSLSENHDKIICIHFPSFGIFPFWDKTTDKFCWYTLSNKWTAANSNLMFFTDKNFLKKLNKCKKNVYYNIMILDGKFQIIVERTSNNEFDIVGFYDFKDEEEFLVTA